MGTANFLHNFHFMFTVTYFSFLPTFYLSWLHQCPSCHIPFLSLIDECCNKFFTFIQLFTQFSLYFYCQLFFFSFYHILFIAAPSISIPSHSIFYLSLVKKHFSHTIHIFILFLLLASFLPHSLKKLHSFIFWLTVCFILFSCYASLFTFLQTFTLLFFHSSIFLLLKMNHSVTYLLHFFHGESLMKICAFKYKWMNTSEEGGWQ